MNVSGRNSSWHVVLGAIVFGVILLAVAGAARSCVFTRSYAGFHFESKIRSPRIEVWNAIVNHVSGATLFGSKYQVADGVLYITSSSVVVSVVVLDDGPERSVLKVTSPSLRESGRVMRMLTEGDALMGFVVRNPGVPDGF